MKLHQKTPDCFLEIHLIGTFSTLPMTREWATKSTRIAYSIFLQKKLPRNVQTIHQSFTLWFQRCLVGKLKLSAAQMWQLSAHLMGWVERFLVSWCKNKLIVYSCPSINWYWNIYLKEQSRWKIYWQSISVALYLFQTI